MKRKIDQIHTSSVVQLFQWRLSSKPSCGRMCQKRTCHDKLLVRYDQHLQIVEYLLVGDREHIDVQ